MRASLSIIGLLLTIGAAVSVVSGQSSTPPGNQLPQAAGTAQNAARKTRSPANQDAVPDAPSAGAPAASAPTADPQGISEAASKAEGDGAASSPAVPEAVPRASTADQAAPGKHPSRQDNPFPEEDSKAAASGEKDSSAGDTAGSSTSRPDHAVPAGDSAADSARDEHPAASGSGGSSSQQGLDKLDLYGDKDKKGRKRLDSDAGSAYDPKAAKQDDKIGDFYLKNGNAPGAYARYKEAAQHDAGDADAVFGMAEAARQLNLRDEAAQGYQTYLFAFPDGPKARLARRALSELKVESKR